MGEGGVFQRKQPGEVKPIKVDETKKNLDLVNIYVEKSANDLLIFSVFQAALLLAPPYLVKKTKKIERKKWSPLDWWANCRIQLQWTFWF